MNELKGSLKELNASFKNLFKKLFENNPWLYLILALLSIYIFKVFTLSEGLTNAIIGLMIVIMSIVIYYHGTSYAETTLSLIVSLIALFSLSWQSNNHAILFGILFFIYTLLIISIKSIKLSIELESILTKASLNYKYSNENQNHLNQKEIYNKLYQLIKELPDKHQNNNNTLTLIDKAISVEYLSLRDYPIKYLYDAFNLIEMIKVVFRIDFYDSIKFYHYLYTIHILRYGSFDSKLIKKYLDLLVTTPLDFNQLYSLLNKLKKYIIEENISIFSLLLDIKKYASKGLNTDDIYNEITNNYATL